MTLDLMLPYWGDPEYARQTVRSVLAQTSDDWHLTIIDDAYPGDELGRFVASLGDARITYRRKERNEGLVANFRSCVAEARRPLMTMLGSDDRLLPTYVAEVLATAERFGQATMIQPGVRVIDAAGRPASGLADTVKQRLLRPGGPGHHVLGGEDLAVSLLTGNWLYWPSLAFRTEAIQSVDFNDDYTIILDLDVILRLVMQGATLAVSPEVCFEYRRHEASESSTALLEGSRFAGERAYFGDVARQLGELGWRRAQWAARLHLTSRLHAAAVLPTAVRTRPNTVPGLLRHALLPG